MGAIRKRESEMSGLDKINQPGKNKSVLTDESLMMFGKYSGKQLVDVPDSYLIWLYKETKATLRYDLKKYIEDSIDAKRLR